MLPRIVSRAKKLLTGQQLVQPSQAVPHLMAEVEDFSVELVSRKGYEAKVDGCFFATDVHLPILVPTPFNVGTDFAHATIYDLYVNAFVAYAGLAHAVDMSRGMRTVEGYRGLVLDNPYTIFFTPQNVDEPLNMSVATDKGRTVWRGQHSCSQARSRHRQAFEHYTGRGRQNYAYCSKAVGSWVPPVIRALALPVRFSVRRSVDISLIFSISLRLCPLTVQQEPDVVPFGWGQAHARTYMGFSTRYHRILSLDSMALFPPFLWWCLHSIAQRLSVVFGQNSEFSSVWLKSVTLYGDELGRVQILAARGRRNSIECVLGLRGAVGGNEESDVVLRPACLTLRAIFPVAN
ncbi:hypothetical protein R3P38DRAFT_2816463 [Favolaschia claudopus]|uniref:Uncharacterized protein n=1 Tax=Favolaschia claudopus TaxID=2862362 RepID=A0AAV9YYQ2_9AGAR